MGFLSKLYESVRVNSKLVDHVNEDDIYNVSNRSVGPVQHVRVNSTLVDAPNDNELYNASTQTIGSGNETVTAGVASITEGLRLRKTTETISSGSILQSSSFIEVNGESGSADDLSTMGTGSEMVDGQVVVLVRGDADITVVDAGESSNEFHLEGATNFTLDDPRDTLTVIRREDETAWLELSRQSRT